MKYFFCVIIREDTMVITGYHSIFTYGLPYRFMLSVPVSSAVPVYPVCPVCPALMDVAASVDLPALADVAECTSADKDRTSGYKALPQSADYKYLQADLP